MAMLYAKCISGTSLILAYQDAQRGDERVELSNTTAWHRDVSKDIGNLAEIAESKEGLIAKWVHEFAKLDDIISEVEGLRGKVCEVAHSLKMDLPSRQMDMSAPSRRTGRCAKID
ncbi:hypothetical protein GP486_007505 [Trichoglossum hirsutum]|uniref:Uncharacterized protein n=1 Tax=Trichoglossum hirsutum TaxID=265104 RepID=A0A9P8ICM3_9PEZI|nr:hypothetical protein GP486_007505 [Trichoglossum hirsutum]